MNYRRQCYQRNNHLLETLSEWGVLNTEQLRILIYPSARVAQRRLASLTQDGVIKRNTQIAPYFYYLNYTGEPMQRIGVNWCRLWLDHRRKSWERTVMDYSSGIYTVVNTVTGASKEYRITDTVFHLPGDNIFPLTDDLINKYRRDLLCVK
jgi:hypothetical protein